MGNCGRRAQDSTCMKSFSVLLTLIVLVPSCAPTTAAQNPADALIAAIEGPQTGRDGELAALTLAAAMQKMGVPGVERRGHQGLRDPVVARVRRRRRHQRRDGDARHAVSSGLDQQARRGHGGPQGRAGRRLHVGSGREPDPDVVEGAGERAHRAAAGDAARAPQSHVGHRRRLWLSGIQAERAAADAGADPER